jgi:hypothetical protein
MLRGINRAFTARAVSRSDRHALERRFGEQLNGPKLTGPYRRHRRRRRRRAWAFAAFAVTAGFAALIIARQPHWPAATPLAQPTSEARIVPDPIRIAKGLHAADVRPVLLAAPRPEADDVLVMPHPRSAEPAAPALREVVTTAKSGANMRSAPAMSSNVLWTAPSGTRLRVEEEDGSWLQVVTPNGERAGWMHRSVVAD